MNELSRIGWRFTLALGALLTTACSSDGSNDASGAGASGASGAGGTGATTAGSGQGAAGGSGSGQSGAGGSGGGGAGPMCAPITTFETGLTPSATLHVATTGSADAGGTEQEPFDSIEAAVAAAEPGTAIVVHAGQYAGDIFLSNVNGTAEAPIWIGGAPGEARPIIGSAANAEALHVAGARYLVLHDLEVTGTTSNGLNIDDRGDYADPEALRHLVIRNLSIYDVGAGGNNDCLKISGANDFFILDSEFANCSAGGSNIDHVGCHDGLVAGNSFTGGGTSVQAKGGSRNIEVRGNVFTQVGGRAVNMGGATGFEFFRPPLDAAGENFEARDIRVVANVFDRAAEVAAMPGCVDCLFAHNTVYLPTTRILRILQETVSAQGFTFLPASGGRVENNLLVYTRAEITSGGRAINVGEGTDPASFTYTNNLWYASDDVAGSTDVDYQGATVTGTLDPADPGFTDPENGDFTLTPTSPAAGAGVSLSEVPQDLAGTCYDAPPSLGAFELSP